MRGQKGTTAFSLQQKKTPLNHCGRFALLIHGKSHLVLLTSRFCLTGVSLNFISLIEVFLSVLCHLLHLESPSFYPPVSVLQMCFHTSLPCDERSLSLFLLVYFKGVQGFPNDSVGKDSACNAGDTGDASLIPGSGRSPGGGNGNPALLPEKYHGQRSLVGYSPWGCKQSNITKPARACMRVRACAHTHTFTI